MNRKTIEKALAEAHRFIAACEALPEPEQDGCWGIQLDNYYPKQQGAIKRSSMDLTRALAEMRRPC